MIEHSENHHFLHHRLLTTKMDNLYIFLIFLNFVKSLISIFIPIYIYSVTNSIFQVIIWTSIFSIIYILTIPIGINILNKIGFKWIIFISNFFLTFQIIILNFITISNYFIYFNAIICGFYSSLFWPAIHCEISFNSNKKNISNNYSKIQILTILVGAIAPLIGGFFLEGFGYTYLIILSIVLLSIGTIPLLKSKDITLQKIKFHYKDYFKLNKKYKKSCERFVFSTEGVNSIIAVILFPIFLFILLKNNFLNLGILISSFSFIIGIFLFIFKKKFNKYSNEKLNKIFSKIKSFSWGFRCFFIIFSFPITIIYEFFHNLQQSFSIIPYMSIFYKNVKKEKYLNYILYREFKLHTIKILFCLFLLSLILIFPKINLIYFIIIAIFSSLIYGTFLER